ncbi:hypothetical protein [Neorhodopirellula pilleata]|uniref:Uncharacterized protein n=1 Tax=Neorhodopirellula pilleata TaxID=2714738 RepID=A0A5C5ZXF2_9BACT|nr:hypothetical protein [Neorhodopirellula pilleata]TWT91820.1 hypothetical protein Pla100_48580 [Neorhodopirellula pilleata]
MFSAQASSESANRPSRSLPVLLGVFWLSIIVVAPGCSIFSGGVMGKSGLGMIGLGALKSESSQDGTYVPVGGDAALPSVSFNQEAYQAVRKAKQDNAIVLQILENDEPLRVLPLPAGNVSGLSTQGSETPSSGVFVSTLLTQTGVLQKYGRVQAALYRPSPSSFEGVRMDVLFSPNDKHQVRPESDYALRPGDRLVIRKDDSLKLDSILGLKLGR